MLIESFFDIFGLTLTIVTDMVFRALSQYLKESAALRTVEEDIVFCCLLLLSFAWSSMDVSVEALGVYRTSEPLAVGDGGQVLLACSADMQLLLLDSFGGLVGKFGRLGQGPGEFQGIGSVLWSRSDHSYWVHDPRTKRLTRLSSVLKLEEIVQLETNVNRPIQIAGDCFFVALDNNGDRGSRPYMLQQSFRGPSLSQRLAMRPPLTETFGFHAEVGGWAFFKSYIWDPKLLFAMGKDFYVVNFSNENFVEVHTFGQENQSSRRFGVTFPRVPLSEVYVQDELAENHPAEALPIVKKHYHPPKFWANHIQILVDDQDSIWIFGPKPNASNYPYQIFNQQGQLQKSGTFADLPKVIHQGMAFGLKKDEHGTVFLWSRPVSGH